MKRQSFPKLASRTRKKNPLSRLRHNFFSFALGIFCIPIFFTCKPSHRTILISIKTTDGTGNPLPGVHALVGDESLGYTNQQGKLHSENKISFAAVLRLQLIKEDADFYYSNFATDLTPQEDGSLVFKQDIELLKIPKPHKEKLAATATSNQPPAATPLPVQVTTETVTVAATNTEGSNSDNIAKEASETSPAVEETQVNVHAFYGSKGLAQVAISYKIDDTALMQFGCTTNTRGRCLMKLPKFQKVTIQAERDGFIAASTQLESAPNEPISLSMQPQRKNSLTF